MLVVGLKIGLQSVDGVLVLSGFDFWVLLLSLVLMNADDKQQTSTPCRAIQLNISEGQSY